MIILYLFAVAFIYFTVISIKKKTLEEESTFFDRSFSTCLKGISIVMVVLCHIFKYFGMKGIAAVPFWIIGGLVDQTAVASFFLFSGFGIMLGFIRDGRSYAKKIILRHVLLLLLFNVIFLSPYVVRDIVQNGMDRPWYFYLEVLVGFENLGNVGWFNYAILFCYLSSALCGLLPDGNPIKKAVTVTIGCLVYTVVVIVLGHGSHAYDTIFAFPAGMFIALYQEKIKAYLSDLKRVRKIMTICAVGYIPLTLLYAVIKDDFQAVIRIPKLFLFLGIILCVDRIYTFRSKLWCFLGQHTWPIFVLHMLPIRMLQGTDMPKPVTYLAVAALIAGVSAIGILIEMLAKRIFIGNKEKQ